MAKQALQWLLWPFALLYDLITRLRNWLYDNGWKKASVFDVPTICVGNLTVGGTGKTPHVEYLLRLLHPHYCLATLSRGYGRQTKGFLLADNTASANSIGDEPMQLYLKFSDKAMITVGERRAGAIPRILALQAHTQAILLDDAYQHRALQPSFSILLTDYNRPFYKDWLLPMGRLRECRAGAKRATAIIVTKCPAGLGEDACSAIELAIAKYAPGVPIFFTTIVYGQPIPLSGARTHNGPWLAVSGLARPQPFIEYLQQTVDLHDHSAYPDHHAYQPEEVSALCQQARAQQAGIIMTEKDAVKWEKDELRKVWKSMPVYKLPIEIAFLHRENAFQALLLSHLQTFARSKKA